MLLLHSKELPKNKTIKIVTFKGGMRSLTSTSTMTQEENFIEFTLEISGDFFFALNLFRI